MYINWEWFWNQVLIIFIILIPQNIIILRQIYYDIVLRKIRNMDSKDSESREKLKTWADHKMECILELYTWDSYNCRTWYKVFYCFMVSMDVIAAILMLILLVYPSENSDMKNFLNKEYPKYTALEHPTAKQCREAENANALMKGANGNGFTIGVEYTPIDTALLWAKFYRDVDSKAELLKEASNDK